MAEEKEKAVPREEGGGQAGGDGGPATESKHQPLTTDVGGPDGLHPHHAAVADAYMAHYAKSHPWMNYAKSCYEASQAAAGTPHGSVPGATNVNTPGGTGMAGGDEAAVYAKLGGEANKAMWAQVDNAGRDEHRGRGKGGEEAGYHDMKDEWEKYEAGEMKTPPIPASPQTPPFNEKYKPEAPAVPTDYAANQQAILYARVEAENKQLRDRVAAIERDRLRARAEQYATQIAAENYEFDFEREVNAFMALPPAQWEGHANYVRKYHKKREPALTEPVPYAAGGLVPLYRGRVEAPPEDVSARAPTAAEARAAVLYCQSSDKPVSYDDALLMAKKGELNHLLKNGWRDTGTTSLRR